MNHKGKIFVIKADGQRVPFDYNKVRQTCIRAGASRQLADSIVDKISGQLYQDIRTREVYKMVLRALSLEESGNVIGHRYRLKESIMRMGPAGSRFEEFVAKILENSGYRINSIRVELDGKCVKHEVDIAAYHTSEGKRTMVECKYHNLPGIFTGVKESLYTHARFLDLGSHFDAEMLVTNTKVSTDVISYASCIGQEVLSWRYPKERGLERLIEEHGLYPLTILPLSRKETFSLYENGITLAKDLLSKDPSRLAGRTGISVGRIGKLQSVARQIIV